MAKKEYMELTLHLQKKYNKVNELQDMTKQMAECLQRNDIVSFELLMKMRGALMLELDSMEYVQEDILKGFSQEDEMRARGALNGVYDGNRQEAPELCRINEIYLNTKKSLQSTVQYDKAISLKVGGETSFYKAK